MTGKTRKVKVNGKVPGIKQFNALEVRLKN